MMGVFLNKRGSVSIFFTLLLIPILSFSTVLMEIARYRSAKAILSEITDNGLYSMLAYYDSGLMDRFGMMALDPEVDVAEMTRFLQEAANEMLENPTNLEKLMSIGEGDVSAEKLYPLSDPAVLERQIMEYSKYRVPVNLAMDMIDIDSLIEELNDMINNAIPLLNEMQAATKVIEKVFATVEAAFEYNDAHKDVKKKQGEYDDKYEKLYDAIEEKVTYMQDNNPEDQLSLPEKPELPPDPTKEDKEAYEEEMKTYKEEKKEYDKELKELKKEYEKEIKKYNKEIDKAAKDYAKAVSALSSSLGKYLEANKSVSNNINGFSDIYYDYTKEENRQEIEKSLGKKTGNEKRDAQNKKRKEKAIKTSDGIRDSLKDYDGVFHKLSEGISEDNERKVENCQDLLRKQKEWADGLKGSDIGEGYVMWSEGDENYHCPSIPEITAANLLADVIGEIEQLIKKLIEAIEVIVKLVQVIAFFTTGPSTYDLDYRVNIQNGDLLPSRDGAAIPGKKDFQDNDLQSVRDQLRDSQAVADELGYELDRLSASENYNDPNQSLDDAIQRTVQAIQNLIQLCVDFHDQDTLEKIIDFIPTIIEIFVTLGSVFVNIIRVINCFSSMLLQTVTKGIALNTYAVGQFSNRTNADEGFEKYEDYRGEKAEHTEIESVFGMISRPVITFTNTFEISQIKDVAFSGAEVEYILKGGLSEIGNQQRVYWNMFAIRLLLNIFPVLQVVQPAEIITFLIYVVWLAAETFLDMQFLTEAGAKVPLIKTQDTVYLSPGGLDDLVDQLKEIGPSVRENKKKSMMKSVAKKLGVEVKDTDKDKHKDKDKEKDKNKAEDGKKKKTIGGLILDSDFNKWSYSTYIWFLLCFQSNNTKLKRICDLMQMEMSHKQYHEKGMYLMKDAHTYIRADVKAKLQPILPIPSIDGANQGWFDLEKIYYGGY